MDRDSLVNELDLIRKRGYGFDNEERELGVSCIGAPLFDLNNEAIASFTISGPTARFTEKNKEKWLNIVLKVSEEATNRLKIID